jgi:Bifunctional DNA primase/polymerase, N-terminal
MQALSEWLVTVYPENVLMPIRKGMKSPMFPHVSKEWSWTRFEEFSASERALTEFDVGILLKTLCVIDVDNIQLAVDLEDRFPFLKQVACEQTLRGRHYFFERSPLCDLDQYYDQTSSVMKKVDFKTITRSGNASVIVVAPSTNKQWIRAPWDLGDLLQKIPDDLLQAVAVQSVNALYSVKFIFPDGGELISENNPHLLRFELICNYMHYSEESALPDIILHHGNVQTMQDLLNICARRQFERWPVDLGAVQKLADYLCCNEQVYKAVVADIPSYSTTWMVSLDSVASHWASAHISHSVIDISHGAHVHYDPLPKDSRWLFPVHDKISLQVGTCTVRADPVAYAEENMPEIVVTILQRHPELALAGGAALDLACPHLLNGAGDYDLYFIGTDDTKALQILHDLVDNVLQGVNIRSCTGSAYTWIASDEYGDKVIIQLILRRFRNIEHVLSTFDMAPSQVALHDGRLLATESCLCALKHMAVFVNFHKWTPASVSRIFKYYYKGFEVFVPGTRRELFKPLARDIPGIMNVFTVENCISKGSKFTSRPVYEVVSRAVQSHKVRGFSRESGYEEAVTERGIFYVVHSMIASGMHWMGLRPKKTVPLTSDVPKIIQMAGDEPFYLVSPHFSALYNESLCVPSNT